MINWNEWIALVRIRINTILTLTNEGNCLKGKVRIESLNWVYEEERAGILIC